MFPEAGLGASRPGRTRHRGGVYPAVKRSLDIGFSLAVLLPAALAVAAVLLVLNPLLNPGPLFYRPRRMGLGCRPFRAWKFRTMQPAGAAPARGTEDPVETARMNALGRFLRRSRFDELPQIVNVLRGEMSLIGPRPDDYAHACVFLRSVPGYRRRHAVRPGISGLAQVELGYVEGFAATCAKTRLDLEYIAHAGFALDAHVFRRTIGAVWSMAGR
jgi:lipopolysaccharide/colanic/teichoic acid biosynthesis glycosyltransferase